MLPLHLETEDTYVEVNAALHIIDGQQRNELLDIRHAHMASSEPSMYPRRAPRGRWHNFVCVRHTPILVPSASLQAHPIDGTGTATRYASSAIAMRDQRPVLTLMNVGERSL